MNDELLNEIQFTVSQFLPSHEIVTLEQYFGGHINQTFFITTADTNKCKKRYVLQNVNRHVFPKPVELMENIARITEEMERYTKTSSEKNQYLKFIKSSTNTYYYDMEKTNGDFWRMYEFIENTTGKNIAENTFEAYSAGLAFGRFQGMLAELNGPRLHETIENFHNTRLRYETLIKSASLDVMKRLESCKDLYDNLLSIRENALKLQETFEKGLIPERVVHNDAKLSNILLDDTDGHAVCVIDLDTCMPGLMGHDFGDLARSICNSSSEDEKDLSKINASMEMFEAIVKGYIEGAGKVLLDEEILTMPDAAITLTTEVAVRFLTDYLDGDKYFHISFENQNLVRATAQYHLAKSFISQYYNMKSICKKFIKQS